MRHILEDVKRDGVVGGKGDWGKVNIKRRKKGHLGGSVETMVLFRDRVTEVNKVNFSLELSTLSDDDARKGDKYGTTTTPSPFRGGRSSASQVCTGHKGKKDIVRNLRSTLHRYEAFDRGRGPDEMSLYYLPHYL